jgi:hypothetical protein
MKFKLNVRYIITKSDNENILVGDTMSIDHSKKAADGGGFGYDWYGVSLPVRNTDKSLWGMIPQCHYSRYETKELLLDALKTVEGEISKEFGQTIIDMYQAKIAKIKIQYEI